jgi:hypothetical protein
VLILTLIISSGMPAFGQTSSSSTVTVMTDKSSYSDGDQIIISGTVNTQLNVPISIVVKDPSQNIVTIGQVTVNTDNTYSTPITAGGRLWTATGVYEIDVTYGSKDNTAKTTFEFNANMTGMSGNMTGSSGTNTTVPEFGPMTFIALVISMMALVIFMRTRLHCRIP